MSVKVGDKAPNFSVKALMPNKLVENIMLEKIVKNNKWVLLFFYPKNFTKICPTEILALSDRYNEFALLDVEIFGVSTDTIMSHQKWTGDKNDDKGIGLISFPLISDESGHVSKLYNVYNEVDQTAYRGTFIISPAGKVQYMSVLLNNVGRNMDELVRVTKALQTGGNCPANWKPGDNILL